jgi:hypothetical protein
MRLPASISMPSRKTAGYESLARIGIPPRYSRRLPSIGWLASAPVYAEHEDDGPFTVRSFGARHIGDKDEAC